MIQAEQGLKKHLQKRSRLKLRKYEEVEKLEADEVAKAKKIQTVKKL